MADEKLPRERPVQRRVDHGGADADTLVDMGAAEPQPEPAPPTRPGPPEEPPGQAENMVLLDAALTEAGVEKTGADTAAVRSLATLDTATVQTVARWVKRGKKDNGTK
ncbi:hypothetical protein [Streptomyces sp. NPDC002889]|uniref:hypothetical protein n=1 Tax=Streptomyces sp. NPDC002889 TaxID=3364669 RepID=UPI00368724AF